MAWTPLKTSFKDAVWSGLRKYQEQSNSDGTKSFKDVTEYLNKEDSLFGAKEVNAIAEAINTIMHMVENGTDLYTAFQTYFDTQKSRFTAETNTAMQEYERQYQTRITQFEQSNKSEFNSWMNGLRNQLDGIDVGKLQQQINSSNEQIRQNTDDISGIKYSMKSLVPRENLLTNSNFQLWQRGTDFQFSAGKYQYFADRWCVNATVNISKVPTGVHFSANCNAIQWLSIPSGKQYTVSCSVDGTKHEFTFSADSSNVSNEFLGYDTSKLSSGYVGIYVKMKAGQTLNWVKLETGANSTAYAEKSYVLEEMDCSHYFVHYKGSIHPSAIDSKGVWGTVPLPYSMRTKYPLLILGEGTSVKRQDGTASVEASAIKSNGIMEGGHTLSYGLTTPAISWKNEPAFVDMNCLIDAEVY